MGGGETEIEKITAKLEREKARLIDHAKKEGKKRRKEVRPSKSDCIKIGGFAVR